MRLKHLGLPLIGFTLVFGGSASAGMVQLSDNNRQPVIQDFLSVVDSTVSVIEAPLRFGSTHTVEKGKKTSFSSSSTPTVLALLSSPIEHGKKFKPAHGIGNPAPKLFGGDLLTATPEPPFLSLALFGLLGTGLLFARRYQNRRS